MFKLIRGETYRIFRKISFYIYFGALFAFYLSLTFARSGGMEADSVVKDFTDIIGFFAPLAGGYMFMTFYADDLSSKVLTSLVGFGIGKVKIILVKFILTVVFCAALLGALLLAHFAIYAASGFPATPDYVRMVLATALYALMTTFVYVLAASIAVYGLQRVTFAAVTYFLLALNIIGGLIAVILNQLELNRFADHIPSHVAQTVMANILKGDSITYPLIEYLLFVAAFFALSVIAFHQKEMEF